MEIILGDNPFFGVNHRSQEKAADYLNKKGDFSAASEVIRRAHFCGVQRIMLSNHGDLGDLLRKVRKDDKSVSGVMDIALVVPYAQKFNQIVGAHGVLGLFRHLPFVRSLRGSLALIWSYLITRRANIKDLIGVLIDAELENIEGFEKNVTTICLHNIVSDLCIGLGKTDFVLQFCQVVRSRGLNAVVITQNPLDFDGILPEDVVVCFTYNVGGFMVNPGVLEVRNGLSFKRKYWAMGILASGAISLDAALEDEFLKNFAAVLYATGDAGRVQEGISRIRLTST